MKKSDAGLNAKSSFEYLKVFCIAVLSRLLLFFAAVTLYRISGGNTSLRNIFSNSGDVPHYLNIAEHWYQSSGDNANLIVFYPLYPVLMAVFRVIFRSYLLSGLIISYISFGLASLYLYRLLRLDYSAEKTAGGMLLLMLAAYGVFFISAHTESLFIMLLAMGFFYIRERKWLAAAIIGFFAALTRTQGVLLFLPLIYEIVLEAVKTKKFKGIYLSSLLVPAGYICYLLLNLAICGDAFKFLEYQAAKPWYNTSKWIAQGLETSYSVGARNPQLALYVYHAQIAAYFIGVAAIFAGAYKRVRTSYLLFTGAYIGITYFHGWMLSGCRYTMACLPLYIIFAAIDNKYVKYIIILISGMLMLPIAVLWLRGYAIM